MNRHSWLPAAVAGLCAGAVNGLFGAGGGMVLVPLLSLVAHILHRDHSAHLSCFPCSNRLDISNSMAGSTPLPAGQRHRRIPCW